MILKGNMLYASAGKYLHCTYNGIDYGKEVSLGNVWYDGEGVRLEEPYRLSEADFEEVESEEYAQLVAYLKENLPEGGATYAMAKAMAVKYRYSYDDQIALMLNYAEYPEEYRYAYDEMQQWRELAGQAAKEATGKKE